MLVAVPLRIHLLGLTGALMILSVMVAQPVLPLYLQRQGLPPAEVGLVVGLLSFALILTELSAFAVSRRLGRRGTLLLGNLGGAAATLWFALAAARPEWYASRMLAGAFRGLLWPVLFAEVSEAAPQGRHARAFSLFWLYFGVGLLAGPLIGGWVGDRYGLRAPLLLAAVLTLFPAALGGASSRRRDVPIPPAAALAQIVRRREVALLCVLNAIATTVFGLYLTVLPLYGDARGLSAAQIGIVFAVGSVVFTAAQLPVGRLLERLAPGGLLVPAFLIRGAATAAVPLFGSAVGLAALNGAASVVSAVIPPALSGRVAAVAGAHAVVVMGGFNAAADVGFFLGPVLAGAAAEYGLPWAFALALPLSAAGAALTVAAFRRAAETPVPAERAASG